MGASWRSTRPSFALSIVIGSPAWCSCGRRWCGAAGVQDGAKNAHVKELVGPSFHGAGHGWAVVGPTKPGRSCPSWPQRGNDMRQRSFRNVRCRQGACVGVANSLRGTHGSDGDTPSTWENEGEHRHAGLVP